MGRCCWPRLWDEYVVSATKRPTLDQVLRKTYFVAYLRWSWNFIERKKKADWMMLSRWNGDETDLTQHKSVSHITPMVWILTFYFRDGELWNQFTRHWRRRKFFVLLPTVVVHQFPDWEHLQLPGRQQFVHVIFAPQAWSGYEEAYFPGSVLT